MGVVISDVDALMTHPVGNGRGREAHVNQKRYRAVSDVVDSDALDPGLFRAPLHLPVEIALGDGEHPVIRPDAVEHFEIILDFIRQELRHGDDAVAFLSLWRGNQVLTVQPLIGFIDRHGAFLKIEISGSEGQQLPLPDTAPVEHLERIEREGLVHHGLRKF